MCSKAGGFQNKLDFYNIENIASKFSSIGLLQSMQEKIQVVLNIFHLLQSSSWIFVRGVSIHSFWQSNKLPEDPR